MLDSSFDDVVSLGYLEARGALDLIERRILGLRRQQLFGLLARHAAAGRLELEELDRRVERVADA